MENNQSGEQDQYLESNWDQNIQKFEDLNLNPDLLRGIFGYGFVKPSVIQQKGILPIIQKKDTIAQAQSGSGKTATFTIGLLQLIEPAEVKIQAMVLAPTRELADQIKTFMTCVGTYLNVKVHLCTGGTDIAEDRRAFQDGVHVVVGTPGRVHDMIKRDYLNTNYLRVMVLDEADEMLGRGFLDQVNDILKQVPSDTQICMFSATMPPEVIKMTDGIMNDPAKILVKNEDITLAGIKQFYISCSNDDVKFENMVLIFSNMEITQCIIYVNKREKADQLADKMTDKGFVVSCIHGQMKQEQRNQIMKEFRSASTRILISTDLLARGIDVQPVGLVINFDLPQKKENYIHRVGRSGRFGRRGIAINLITKLEAKVMIDIEEHYSTQISKLPDDLSEIEK